MPLLKGKKAKTKKGFKQNIKTEVKAGKPVKQAVAIAYSLKRGGKKKTGKKKVAKESFDSVVNNILNSLLFAEDITTGSATTPTVSPADLAKKTLEVKKRMSNQADLAKKKAAAITPNDIKNAVDKGIIQ